MMINNSTLLNRNLIQLETNHSYLVGRPLLLYRSFFLRHRVGSIKSTTAGGWSATRGTEFEAWKESTSKFGNKVCGVSSLAHWERRRRERQSERVSDLGASFGAKNATRKKDEGELPINIDRPAALYGCCCLRLDKSLACLAYSRLGWSLCEVIQYSVASQGGWRGHKKQKLQKRAIGNFCRQIT